MFSIIDKLQLRLKKFLNTDIHYVTHNGAWILLSFGVLFIVNLATAWGFANFLPASIYGSYKFVLTAIALISIATLPGMEGAVIRSIAKGNDACFKRTQKIKMKWGLLGTLTGFVAAGYYFIQGNTEFVIIFSLVAIFAPLMHSFRGYGAILNAKKDFRKSSLYTIVSQTIISVAVFSTLFLTDSLITLVTVYVFFSTAIYYFLLKRSMKLMLTKSTSESDPVSYGKHLSALQAVGIVSTHVDTIIIWHFLGPVAVATYAFGLATTQPFQKLFKSLMELSFPKFITTDEQVLKKTLPPKVFKSTLLLAPFIIAFALVIPFLYRFLFPLYLDSIPFAQALIIIFFLLPFRFFGNALASQKKIKATYVNKLVIPIIKIILSLILIPLFGIWGAILSLGTEKIISSTLTYIMFKRM
ncbi:MAG: oligosaccharide flippase family protein [Candidatus Pacebacteria bacterium]|nr:oligosaccharide flippase family protein [Candidatus Paceibacterota bacterium]